MSVVVSRIVGNALNSCGERIASVVKSTTTAIVKFADSRMSSTLAGIGTTSTRIAPIKRHRHHQPAEITSAGTGFHSRSAFWEASSSSTILEHAAGFLPGRKRKTAPGPIDVIQTEGGRSATQPAPVAPSNVQDETEVQNLGTCGGTIPPIDACVQIECEAPE